jgi:hypothetical protein
LNFEEKNVFFVFLCLLICISIAAICGVFLVDVSLLSADVAVVATGEARYHNYISEFSFADVEQGAHDG